MSDFSKEAILSGINRVSRENGHSDMSSVIFNTWYGINHRGTGSPAPTNADQHGLTFFTRPNLNLSYDNLKSERIFLPLLDRRGSGVNSIFTAIRLLLDKDAFNGSKPGDVIKSNLVDNKNPFICLLSNNLLSLSGWQDIVIDTYTSKEGRARDAWSMADGIARIYQVTSMSASFRNMIGDPITLLFFYWVHYISLVYEGRITPKPESIVENEIDYMTRIYRLVLDPSRTYVRKISCCGAAFPTSVPIGASHNFSVDAPYNLENKDVSINFQVIGFEYLDPIIVREFNTVVALFAGGSINKNKGYVRIANRDEKGKLTGEPDELNILNYRGIPYIDPITYELSWYMDKESYQKELKEGKNILEEPANRPTTTTTTTTTSKAKGKTEQPAEAKAFTTPFDVRTGYMVNPSELVKTELPTDGSAPVDNSNVG
jgi:hypothetical protein